MGQVTRTNRERGSRLQRFDAVAQHIIELLKPRLAAFIDRCKDVVKAEPVVREHTRAMNLVVLVASEGPSVLRSTSRGSRGEKPTKAGPFPRFFPDARG
jgi:hypothetical protein